MDSISAVLADRRALIELISAGSKDLGDIAAILGVAADVCTALGLASSLSPAGPAFAAAGKLLRAAAVSLKKICDGLDVLVSASWAEDKIYSKKVIAQRYESRETELSQAKQKVVEKIDKVKKFGAQIASSLSSSDKSMAQDRSRANKNTEAPKRSWWNRFRSRPEKTRSKSTSPSDSAVRSPLKPPVPQYN